MVNSVYAPGSATADETFVWYRVSPRLELGLAYLLKQGAFRGLASYQLVSESANAPSVNVSAGIQGIGTGNPGFSMTFEKNVTIGSQQLNGYVGGALRSNTGEFSIIGGVKATLTKGLSLGVQHDGIQLSPFITYGLDRMTLGLYIVGGNRPAYLVGMRF